MIINLISGPRNVSTALMYSFAQRNDTNVVDEPFYGYYLKKAGVLHPGKKQIMHSMSVNIQEVTESIMRQNHGTRLIFLKNMAHHHIDVPSAFLHAVKNTFLIRRPDELIVSFSKVIKDPTMEDIGVKKSWELYHDLALKDQRPIIMDSGELLKDPERMLKKLCQTLSIGFQPAMLSWPAGARREDGVWAKYWYKQVHKTTGFVKYEARKTEVPKQLVPLYSEAMKYYEEMYSLSIKNV